MTVVLYLDVFFMVNLLMNLILLCLVNRALKLFGKKRRIFAASCFGALAVGVLVAAASELWGIFHPLRLGNMVLQGLRFVFTGMIFYGMFAIAFGKRKRREMLRIAGVCGLIVLAAGGCFEAVYSGSALRFCNFFCSTAGLYCGGNALLTFLRKNEQLKQNLYEVVLYHREKTVHVTAFLDTGNRLFEPYGHQPVHVITKEIAAKIADGRDHMIYIPFSAVGTEHGMLPGIRIEAMELKKDGTLIRCIEQPWLAISSQMLSGTHQYDMLLHGEEQ